MTYGNQPDHQRLDRKLIRDLLLQFTKSKVATAPAPRPRAGNVFYAVPACDAPKPSKCQQIPKLAFFVDDRLEVTMRADQTGTTLRELFGFTLEVQLFRDFESPHDEPVGPDQAANFVDGPVFYTRRKHAKLTIYVNEKPFTEAEGVKHEMTGREIAQLVFGDPNNYDVYQLPDDKGIPLDQNVKVQDCEKFKVIRKTVSGGFETVRIERELTVLRQGGARASFVPEIPAVVYHDIPARRGYPHLQSSDVLVMVPGGYRTRRGDAVEAELKRHLLVRLQTIE